MLKKFAPKDEKLGNLHSIYVDQWDWEKIITLTPRRNIFYHNPRIRKLMEIGDTLNSGIKHDDRAPDYDDWQLNGDILFWYPVLHCAVELSSMGIRVDKKSMIKQLEKAGQRERLKLEFHQMLLQDKLPLTMGGGIGQSRICLFFLKKAHIGEVQASIWPEEIVKECENLGIQLL